MLFPSCGLRKGRRRKRETNPEFSGTYFPYSLLRLLRGLADGVSALVTEKLGTFRLVWT